MEYDNIASKGLTMQNYIGVQFLHLFNFWLFVRVTMKANVQFKTLTECEMCFCTMLFFHGTVISATTC